MAKAATMIATTPFGDQKPGTSGLRKRVTVFQQPHYTENFIQSILDSIPAAGSTLVVGGDGRFYGKEVTQRIVQMCAANGVSRLLVGQEGLLSTPAASHLIRIHQALGGIILTASHNPGGPDADFGIKFNTANGGPAPESVTNQIYECSKNIKEYRLLESPPVNLGAVGTVQMVGEMRVEIVDPVEAYVAWMKDIFDFAKIRAFFASNKNFKVVVDALNGVTGPYLKHIFLTELQLPASSVQNATPLPDFGGLHPDPNLTYAKHLVDKVNAEKVDFAAACDGDGDRAMFLSHEVFVNPCDSVAVLAEYAHHIPYFQKNGLLGLARSMPTSAALDRVAKSKNIPIFETPTGWKFFGNLLDASRISICGEESFGAGSSHIREKDGVWVILAYLNILAAEKTTLAELLKQFYTKYGRHFFTRYDYEEVESAAAQKVMDHLNQLVASGELEGKQVKGGYTVAMMDNFAYADPIDKSITKNQGIRVLLEDGSRIVYRLSGTGSAGATIRVYLEQYSSKPEEFSKAPNQVMAPIIALAIDLGKIAEFTGRHEPSVIT